MQSKNLGYDPTSAYHQDWSKNMGGAQDPYGDESINYDDYGYEEGGDPTVDSYQQPSNVPLDPNTVRDAIDGLLAFAKDQGASRAVISEIEELMGAVDSSATLSPTKQQALLQNIMNELPARESEVVAEAATAAENKAAEEAKAKEEEAAEEAEEAAKEADQERITELEDKITELTEKIAADTSMYQIEKDELLAKLTDAKEAIADEDVDAAELLVAEIEGGLAAAKSEGNASALEAIKAAETKLRDLQYRLEGLSPSTSGFKDLVNQALDKVSQLLADLKSGAVKPEDAEGQIRRIEEDLTTWEFMDTLPKVGGKSMF